MRPVIGRLAIVMNSLRAYLCHLHAATMVAAKYSPNCAELCVGIAGNITPIRPERVSWEVWRGLSDLCGLLNLSLSPECKAGGRILNVDTGEVARIRTASR